MLDSDFDSLDEFVMACDRKRGSLDRAKVLSKVYTMDQIRHMVEAYRDLCGLADEPVISEKKMSKTGYRKRYEFADAFVKLIDADKLGNLLSQIEHQFYFQFVSYARLPKGRTLLVGFQIS